MAKKKRGAARKKESGKRIVKKVRKELKKQRVIITEVKKKHPKTEGLEKSGFVSKDVDGKGIFLETDVDRLLDVITKRGRIKASELAGIFKVPRSKIEEWGIILEDHKLIDMHYPPFGEPMLMVRKLKKKGKKGLV